MSKSKKKKQQSVPVESKGKSSFFKLEPIMKYLPFILLLGLQLYFINGGFYSISADEAGHTLDAVAFYNGASLFGIWLPFQKMFLGLFLFDLFWMPRIISMIFSTLTLGMLMLLTKELFNNEKITITTGFLGSVFMGLTIFGVLPLTEIYFFFFLLLSIYLVLKESNWIILSTIILTSIRFEGWIFAFIISIILYKRIGLKASIVLIFPLFWALLSYFEIGSLIGFISQVSGRKKILTVEDSVLYNFLLISINSLSILGIFYLMKNKIYAFIFISTLIIWTLATYLSGAMATHNVWRVGLIWNILLIPLVAYLVWQIKYKIPAYLLIGLLGYLFIMQSIKYSSQSYTKIEDINAGKEIAKLDGSILMPRYQWEYSNLLITSGKKIDYKEKITDVTGYDYLILMKKVNLPLVYENNKWKIYKLKRE